MPLKVIQTFVGLGAADRTTKVSLFVVCSGVLLQVFSVNESLFTSLPDTAPLALV